MVGKEFIENIPFETAIELLAASVDLKVVAKGDAFFVTTKEQAAELIAEKRKRDGQAKTAEPKTIPGTKEIDPEPKK